MIIVRRYPPGVLRDVPTRDGSILKVDMREANHSVGDLCGRSRDRLLAPSFVEDDPYQSEIGGES